MPPPSGPGADREAGAGYRAVFAVPEFRHVFAAHLLSTLGVVLCEIALSVLVHRLTGSPRTRAATLGDVLGEGDLFVLGRSVIRIINQSGQLAGFAAGGLLLCAMPVGAITGEALAGTFLGPRARARLTFPLGVFCVLPSLGFAARPSLGWAVLLLVLTGTGIAYNFGVDRWFVAAVPDELLGQAMTVMQAGRMTIMGLGMGAAGAAAEYAPLWVVMPAGGVVGAVSVLLVVSEVRRTGGDRFPAPDAAGIPA
ncbi:hypothetical protein ACH4OW_18345 [Streptomyces sp. NPDC017056]|uniref:hypothetical protein n=1 Tax=Streptomyces sp. NPDC017056 TaxID=3364973 RepID=UPI003795A283